MNVGTVRETETLPELLTPSGVLTMESSLAWRNGVPLHGGP